MFIDDMRAHYRNAGNYYTAANNASDDRTRVFYQKAGEAEHLKAYEAAEKAKQDVRTQACREAKEYYDKSAEAHAKGDMKACQEYREQGDKIMADAKEKENQIKNEEEKAESETISKMGNLQRGRYY